MADVKPYTSDDLKRIEAVSVGRHFISFSPLSIRATVKALERAEKERDKARERWRSLAAGEVITAGIAALVDRMTATHIEKARRLTAEVERLTKERDVARALAAANGHADLLVQRDRADAEAKRLRRLIAQAEWAGGDMARPGACPWCMGTNKHAPDCSAFSARGEVR